MALSNLLFLLTIVLVPFSTTALSDRLRHGDQRAAVILYVGLQLLVACAFLNIWLTAERTNLLRTDVSPERIRELRRAYFAGPPALIVVLGTAALASTVALVLTGALLVAYATPRHGL